VWLSHPPGIFTAAIDRVRFWQQIIFQIADYSQASSQIGQQMTKLEMVQAALSEIGDVSAEDSGGVRGEKVRRKDRAEVHPVVQGDPAISGDKTMEKTVKLLSR